PSLAYHSGWKFINIALFGNQVFNQVSSAISDPIELPLLFSIRILRNLRFDLGTQINPRVLFAPRRLC
ncbi:MAG: hypothetical protein VW995_08905, partial [Deltaproteobacteria bacterium]